MKRPTLIARIAAVASSAAYAGLPRLASLMLGMWVEQTEVTVLAWGAFTKGGGAAAMKYNDDNYVKQNVGLGGMTYRSHK